jgi:hypothetical protein
MRFLEFVDTVNLLARKQEKEASEDVAQPSGLSGERSTIHPGLICFYYVRGLTPEQTLREICGEVDPIKDA